jgi:TRAP-type C4-dicarboxylate transport system substrate-binding protein
MTITRKTFLGALAGAAALAAAPAVRAQQTVTLRFHQFLPPQAPVPTQAIKPWAQQVERASGGRIKVQQFDAMQLGGRPPELFDQAKDGVVDVVWTVLGYTPGRFPKAEVFELPFLVGDAETGSRAYWEYVQTHAADEFRDVKLIAAHIHGPGLIHSRNPVTKLEDLRGMKVRGGSRIINIMLEQLGAVPVGMPVPAVGEGLSKGVISATTIPWEVVPSLKVHQIVKNHTTFSGDKALYTQTFGVVMNKARYESLPPDLKKVIDDASGIETSALFGRVMGNADIPGRKAAEAAGNNIIQLDAAETQRWQRAAAGVRATWYAEAAAKGLDGQKLAAEAERLIAKHARK